MSLSDMAPEDLALLRDVWPGIDAVRKEDLLGRLIDLSEDNLDAEFNDLFRFCLGDENPEVRAKAIEGLWECDGRALLTPLITMLREDPSENVRSAAAMALGKFAALSQIGKMLEKDVGKIKEFLMQTIQNSRESQEVRRRAIEAVAPFNTADVQQIIQDAYVSEQIEMRYSAVYAMGKSCDPRWLPTILAELRNPDPAMRYEASNACGAMGEEPTVPHLIALFQDDDRQTQVSAISAVGAIGGSLARKALLHCLKSSDDVAVEAAQEALESLEAGDEIMSFTSGVHTPRPPR
ncbi:MAG: HEAT repeat domain-containing protein [Chloroflexi bacterium]|nr:HEAT repeat domain-containing protein [Chloroflexota bacterium]